MSHTVRISGIEITDVTALQLTVNDLNKIGVSCKLLENTTPRAYHNNQKGMGRAEYVLQLTNAQYDVGLYKKDKIYEPRTDFWGGSVERELGIRGANTPQECLGKMYQYYSVNATERALQTKGISSRRVVKDSGLIQLRAMVA